MLSTSNIVTQILQIPRLRARKNDSAITSIIRRIGHILIKSIHDDIVRQQQTSARVGDNVHLAAVLGVVAEAVPSRVELPVPAPEVVVDGRVRHGAVVERGVHEAEVVDAGVVVAEGGGEDGGWEGGGDGSDEGRAAVGVAGVAVDEAEADEAVWVAGCEGGGDTKRKRGLVCFFLFGCNEGCRRTR